MTRKRRGQRLFLRSSGPNSESIRVGLDWLLTRLSRKETCALCARKFRDFTEGVFAKVVEQKSAADAKRLGHIRFPAGVTMDPVRTYTARTLPQRIDESSVLALWPSDKTIIQLDRIWKGDLLAIPWLLEDYQRWECRWGFRSLDNALEFPTPPPLPKTILSEALESFMLGEHTPKNLSYYSEKERFLSLLYTLQDAGECTDPSLVERNLVGMGWTIESACEAGNIARRFVGPTPPRRPLPSHWTRNAVDIWRDRLRNDKA